MVGLDVAGVDVIVEDPSRPLEAQGGHVVSLTAQPEFAWFLSLAPAADGPAGRALAVVDHLFSSPNNSPDPGRHHYRHERQVDDHAA